MARFLYDKTFGPITITADTELSLSLGATTLVFVTAASGTTFQFPGLSRVGGNLDGLVVTFADVSNVSHTFRWLHDSVAASTLVNRFRNSSGVNLTTTGIGG